MNESAQDYGKPADAAKPMAHLFLHTDDMRISKIIKRLLAENSATNALDLCNNLKNAVRSPANAAYICRSFEFLMESMIEIIQHCGIIQCPDECLEQASVILGLIGYINRADFPIYKNNVTKAYQSTKGVRKYVMLALKTTLSCDAVNLDLEVYSERLLRVLKEYLENAEIAETFIAVSGTIAEFSKNYKSSFEAHFTDIVDIIVGWHLEMDQLQSLKLHCSLVLQQFAPYFLKELDFTFGLLGQFLEDIISFGEDALADVGSDAERQKAEMRFGSFVGAFNSILKSLASRTEFIGISLDHGGIVSSAASVILKTSKSIIESTDSINEDTVLNVNDFFCLLFTGSCGAQYFQSIENVVELQLKRLSVFNNQQIASILYLILSICRQMGTNLPVSLVTIVFHTEGNPLEALKSTENDYLQKLLLKIYHEVLMMKNVPLLQEAYKHIRIGVDGAIRHLESARIDDYHTITKAQSELNFCLAALSAIATQTSSIIGMYALNPSILDLLTTNCRAADMHLWSRYLVVHRALLNTLIVHCQKNHNFRPTSRLLNKHLFLKTLDENNSPTSENFGAILKFLADILSATILNNSNLSMLLNWLNNVLIECQENSAILQKNESFISICKALNEASSRAPAECATCMQVLLKYAALDRKILESFRDTSIEMLDSPDLETRRLFTITLAKLPLAVTFPQSKETSLLSRDDELQQWYRSSAYFAPLRSRYFKTFLDSIASAPFGRTQHSLYAEIFSKCWTLQFRENSIEYQALAQKSSKALAAWAQYEAARYCVRNKLRTTIGKPQDTFLAIEAIVMKYARTLAVRNHFESQYEDLENSALIQKNMRTLLGFLENLEKHIYNAAEGTAFAISPLEKPVKTFFRINSQTCVEWFKRIRTAVNLIAVHSMEPEVVIRTSENILKTAKLDDAHTDHVVTTYVWALLCCSEADTLQGLYVWLKAKMGRRYTWIQHVAEQAAGHREKAAEGYAIFLHENEVKLDSYTKEFLLDQLLDCLYCTGQWAEMRQHLRFNKTVGQETVCLLNARSKAHLDLIESLCCGYNTPEECTKLEDALLELSQWPNHSVVGSSVPANHVGSFSFYHIKRQLEDSCISQIVRNHDSNLPAGVQEAIHIITQEAFAHCISWDKNSQLASMLILNHVAQRLLDGESLNSSSVPLDYTQLNEGSTLVSQYLIWALLFEQRPGGLTHGDYHSLYLTAAASARRECNIKLGRSMLLRFFALKGIDAPLLDIAKELNTNGYTLSTKDPDLLSGFTELAKCLQAGTSSNQLEAMNFASSYCLQLVQLVAQTPLSHVMQTNSHMLLTIADWLQQRGSGASNSPPLQQLLRQLPELEAPMAGENVDSIISEVERAVGKLINASVMQNNYSGEAWCAFGNWCYRWGKKLVEAKSSENISLRVSLSQRDVVAIKAILGDEVGEDIMYKLVEVLNSLQLDENESVDDIEKSESSSTEVVERELRKIDAKVDNLPIEKINSIIRIWRQAHKTFYSYYEMAAKAYFKYLAIEAAQTEPKQADRHISNCQYVTTTLRLLRLIVKHAIGLQEVLEEGLRTTPLRPWKVIIPQLFSRLYHHEPYVRKSVSELLCRLAQDRPHLVIFPAVVGAHQETNSIEPASQVKDATVDSKNAVLSTCFNSLLATLSKQAPGTVLHVQLLVKELKRITLLWEEYWVHSLAQLYAEYSPIFNALEIELKKCMDPNFERIQEKYKILMRHVIADLHRISAVTEKPAETNYERNFQDRYGLLISNTLSEMEKPFNVAKPNDAWMRIKQLYSIFQQRAMRGSASTSKISDLSPVLSNMQSTSISMPGVDTFDKDPIYIKSVDSLVYILPTKTKPKKLAFFGSDGRKYTYLFKGLEDLHLDERIMQFLSISNSMMARSSDYLCNSNRFKAHHYSVIPLGPQSGLISWVDGVTPLFAIYKKWQQRDALLKAQQKEKPLTSQQSVIPATTRPSELFYNKLAPLLAEQNIKVTDPRKTWPLPILRKVLDELSQETPRDLLAKELWCHSIEAAEWRKNVRCYSVSMAVMSAIGYVIGLGDRHLDNVLIKLTTGEIVHIDYNVCFEKGKTLRVPEKIPFRLTPNLEEALGLTGIEGPFRLGCEYVLKTLRKEKETLLTLLEAFVYDPLVDWTVGDDGNTGTTRSTSAHAAAHSIASLDLVAVSSMKNAVKHSTPDDYMKRKQDFEYARQTIELRYNDLRPYWIKYKDELFSKLLKIEDDLRGLVSIHRAYQQEEQERDNLTKQLATVRELEALGSARGSHTLNTITQRFSSYKRDAEAFNAVKREVQHYHDKIDAVISDRIAASPGEGEASRLRSQLLKHSRQLPGNDFEVFREMLEEKGQLTLFEQCKIVHSEMKAMLFQASSAAENCLNLILQYTNVMQFYPHSLIAKSRWFQYSKWCKMVLLEEESNTMASLAAEMEKVMNGSDQCCLIDKPMALKYTAVLKGIWDELNAELQEEIDDLSGHTQKHMISPETAITAIQGFIASSPECHMRATQVCALKLLAEANDSFLLFEKSATNEEQYLLDQQINYIDLVLNMCQTLFPEHNQDTYAPMQLLGSTLTALRDIKAYFDVYMPDRLVRLCMLDDNLELQASLERICESPKSILELLQSAEVTADRDLALLLNEMHNIFENFEKLCGELQELVKVTVQENSVDCNREFWQSRNIDENSCFPRSSWKYEAMSSFLQTAYVQIKCLRKNSVETPYDVRSLTKPITEYVSLLQRSYLCGLAPLFAQRLQNSLSDTLRAEDDALQNAQALCNNLFKSLQQSFSIKSCQLAIMQKTKVMEHFTLVATAHYWANGDVLSDTQVVYGPSKGKLLEAIDNSYQTLVVCTATFLKVQERITAVTQRIEWIIGNEPVRELVQGNFFEFVTEHQLQNRFYLQLMAQVKDLAETLLKFEMLFVQQNDGKLLDKRAIVKQLDSDFLALLKRWQTASANLQRSDALITPVEKAIVTLLDPEGKIDQCWINNIAGLLDDMTFAVQRKLVNLEGENKFKKDELYNSGHQLLPMIDNPIRTDIRHFLKALSKSEKNQSYSSPESSTQISTSVREMQQTLKGFYAKLGELQAQLTTRSNADLLSIQFGDNVRELLSGVEQSHTKFTQLMLKFTPNERDRVGASPSGRRGANNEPNAAAGVNDKKVNQGEQKRNAYAVSVWKRIRMKLEGRDPDPNRRSTVAEQVDYILREAMNPDNLAVLYEGWTPWV